MTYANVPLVISITGIMETVI